MGFELAEVVTKLGERIAFGGEWEGGQDGLMDLSGAPSAQLGNRGEAGLPSGGACGCPGFGCRGFWYFPTRGEEPNAGRGGSRREHPGLGPRTPAAGR